MTIGQLMANMCAYTLEEGLSFQESRCILSAIPQTFILNFDETGLKLKELLDKRYVDGVSGLENVSVDGNTIKGVFTDIVSPSLTKKFNFTINSDSGDIDYVQIDTGNLDKANFSEVEFAGKSQTCKEGKSSPCKREDGSVYCVSLGKKCKSVRLDRKEKAIAKEIVKKGSKKTKTVETKKTKKQLTSDVADKAKPAKASAESKSANKETLSPSKFNFIRKEAATSDLEDPELNGSSFELHSVGITDPKTGKQLQASFGDDSFVNRPGQVSADMVLGDHPQNTLLAKSLFESGSILGGKVANLKGIGRGIAEQQDFLDAIAKSSPDSNRYATLLIPKQKDVSPEMVNELAAKSAKEGDLVVISSPDAKTMDALISGVNATGYPPGKNPVLVGRVKNGKLEPVDPRELETKIKQGEKARSLREQQFEAGVFKSDQKQEEELAKKADAAEDEWLGRKPTGKVKDSKHYEEKADAWAKSMGFSGGANGFTEEATKAHDISHPVLHDMLGKNSQEIHKALGAIKDNNGGNSLVAEEAIVNVLEHLSRGDSFEASLINGLRVAKVLSRNGHSGEASAYFRSDDFKRKLQQMSDDVYRNNDFGAYAALVRSSNRKSGTVTSSGKKFNNTAS